MSKLRKPTMTRVRQANKSIPNSKLDANTSDKSLQNWISRQLQIDDWNTNFVGKKDKFGNSVESLFNDYVLDNQSIVVQLYLENCVKGVITTEDGKHLIVPGISQIDGRKRNTDAPVWIDTPFPVINKGIILSVSPWLQYHYMELREKMLKLNPELANSIVIPEAGDMVTTNHFMYKETRFYPDKQKKTNDFVRSQEEFRLEEFSFMFKISNYDIEAIVKKDSERFKKESHVSPIASILNL